MSPEKQRIAIAELWGYSVCDGKPWLATTKNNPRQRCYPDYPADLNEMRETVMRCKCFDREKFAKQLEWVVARDNRNSAEPIPTVLASSGQWSEAFLRTIGKWEGE